ncbi:MAG: nucleotidyltransferase substrate binding protein [Nitrospinae bacterium]|nr:nucleotidyltransferase substrate binding protein [Nitrospinota bacterium]MBI3813201.1 nucleotidyltransferase substrate binding protein [Nitrospinota bacterium]
MTKLEALIKQFEKALGRFREVMDIPKTDVVRDSAIQRFEFTMDLSWKMLKAFLEDKKGIICTSPKECFREAYRQGIIEYDDDWIKLVDIRNETVHTYNEERAEEIYCQLQNALEHFEIFFKKIKDLI